MRRLDARRFESCRKISELPGAPVVMTTIKPSDRLHKNVLSWGVLALIEPGQDGFSGVVLTGQGSLPVNVQVPSEMASKLRLMVGKQVVIGHVEGRWVCGTKTA